MYCLLLARHHQASIATNFVHKMMQSTAQVCRAVAENSLILHIPIVNSHLHLPCCMCLHVCNYDVGCWR